MQAAPLSPEVTNYRVRRDSVERSVGYKRTTASPHAQYVLMDQTGASLVQLEEKSVMFMESLNAWSLG